MDFGLAKIHSPGGSSRLTKVGATIGTLDYMSPEQVKGVDVDFRTDIFSTGVVLYELLTGESPFKGVHDAAIIYKIVNVEVLPVSEFRKDIEPLLDLLILKCLEKEKENRYQSSKELAEDLKKIKRIHNGEEINHIYKLKRKLFTKGKSRKQKEVSQSIKPKRKPKVYIWISILFIFGIVFSFYNFLFNSKTLNLNPNMKIQEIVTPFTDISFPSISADGNWIALLRRSNYKWDIYLMHSRLRERRRTTNDSAGIHGLCQYFTRWKPDNI